MAKKVSDTGQKAAGTPLGVLSEWVPLTAIHAKRLVRDRTTWRTPDLDDLITSIQAIGLSNPIRVARIAPGYYELVEGWRRLSAFRALHAATNDDRWARIPATLLPREESVTGLYRRMVDENLVRKDISLAEMARLARSYAEDHIGGCIDVDAAVNVLFASASPQKRSYIRRFCTLMGRLEKILEHPEAIPRGLGLEVLQRLDADPCSITELSNGLRNALHRDAATELAILRRFAEGAPPISPRGNAGRGRPAQINAPALRLRVGGAQVNCITAPGRISVQIRGDLPSPDPQRLEMALRAFLAALR